MNKKCGGCGDPVEAGQRVFQLADGQYMRDCITPTYNPWGGVISEWHDPCFRVFCKSQFRPYHCVVCDGEVRDRSDVIYLTVGKKPKPGYSRLEARGYSLPMIAHTYCWSMRNRPPASESTPEI